MDGKTHFKLGITSTIAASICISRYFDNNYILLTGLTIRPIASIITSQLPDIDSKKSKISKIIPIINWIKSEIFLMISLILSLISFFVISKQIVYNEQLFIVSMIMIFSHLFCRYFLKHRKLTHCLLMCAFITAISFYPYYKFQNIILFSIGIGLTIGYLSHIFYDCLTTRGCMLFYPFLKIKIKGPMRSSTDGKIAIYFSYVIIFLSIMYFFI